MFNSNSDLRYSINGDISLVSSTDIASMIFLMILSSIYQPSSKISFKISTKLISKSLGPPALLFKNSINLS